jgi:hypothetical protein
LQTPLIPFAMVRGGEQEATSHSRVGQSRRMNAHDATTVVVHTTTVMHRQPSAATTVGTTLAIGPEGMLGAARALFHNPLGPRASPSIAEQWCHNVDQLIVATINTPLHGVLEL